PGVDERGTTTPAPAPAPSTQMTREWLFERSVLTSADPNTTGRDVRTAVTLPDGGWILGVDDSPKRCLALDSWSCGALVKGPTAMVRLDPTGTVMADRHDGPTMRKGEVFASRHVAVISD